MSGKSPEQAPLLDEAPDLDFGPRASKQQQVAPPAGGGQGGGQGGASPGHASPARSGSQPAATGGATFGDDDGFDDPVPAGLLEISDSRVAAPAAAPNARGPGRLLDTDDDFEDEAAALELDVPEHERVRPPAPEPLSAPELPDAEAEGPSGQAGQRAPSSARFAAGAGEQDGAPPSPPSPAEVLREQARALAAYGAPPPATHFWEAPVYAFRVRTRQGELKRELGLRQNEVRLAKAQLEDALVLLADRARPEAEQSPTHVRSVEAIRGLEQQVRSLDGAYASEVDAHKGRMRQVEAKVVAIEAEVSHLRLEERPLADDLAKRDAAFKRAEEIVRRAEADLRAAPAAPPPAAPSFDRAARARERDLRLAEMNALHPVLADLRQKLEAVRRRLAEAQGRLSAARGERSQHEVAFARHAGTRTAAVEEARARLRQATVQLGRSVVEDKSTFGETYGPARELVESLGAALDGSTRNVALHEEALKVHDEPSVTRGIVLVAASVAFLFLLLMVPFVLRILSSSSD